MTIKQYVLDALGKFWTKLKSTYVTNCASTSNNLALAASQGKVLQDQITALNSRSAIVNWRAYSDIGTAMQTEFANYADGAYNIQAILSGGAMYEIVASVRQGSGSVFWSLGTYTVSGKVYSFDVTNTGIAIKDYQGQIDALNSNLKLTMRNIRFEDISFSAGTPGMRGAQAVDKSTIPSNEYIVAVFIAYTSDSSAVIPFAFCSGVTGNYQNIYFNAYRATSNAVSGFSAVVRVITAHAVVN